MPPRTLSSRALPPRPPVDVTVVLVAHNGETWLPEVLDAVGELTVVPRRVLAVDTGSSDATPALLAAATGGPVTRVVTVGKRVGFGAAVAAALEAEPDAAGGPAAWLWLLHDDSAPAPDALERLLEHARDSPSAGLLGAKANDWDDPRRLVEVGITTDTAGHRETGLERREQDQGQHDAVRDVLAVGTAGALVRRDVWDAVGGLDPALPVFRDDLDLGWRVNAAGSRVVVVPSARVRHARAATTGLRRLDAARGRAEGVDRRHALLVLLAHAPAARLPLLVLRLLLATVVRVAGFLLTRQPRSAADELSAAGAVLLRPGRLRAARRLRAGSRTVPARELRPLLASRVGRARARADAAGTWLSGAGARSGSRLGALGDAGPEELDDLDDGAPEGGVLWRLLTRPAVLLVLALLAVALLAERSVLSVGGGVLAGGRLLPAPGGARDLWGAYAASWHPVQVGTAAPAPPVLAVLAAVATVLLGKAWLAVDVLLLGSVPLAGATAYAAARRVVQRTSLRLWAAATWALLPVATGAVAGGRLDAAAVQVALPLLVLAGVRLVARDPAQVGWRHAWAVGLGLALLSCFAPTAYPVLAALLLAGAALAPRVAGLPRAAALRAAGAAVLALAVPLGLLLPWSAALLSSPGALLHGPGRVVPDDAALAGWHLPLLSPGGPGLPPAWVTAGLLLAALAGTLQAAGRRLAVAGWVVAAAGLAWALLLARTSPEVPGTLARAPAWPGVGLQVAAAGLLLAALVAAAGARSRLAGADFGWRQLSATGVAVLAALVPVATAAAWVVRGADDPLRRGAPSVLPAFVRSELTATPGLRALVLRPDEGGRVGYGLVGGDGPRLGDADEPPARDQVRQLDAVVGDLLAAGGTDAAQALSTRAVRYVVLPAAGAGTLPDVLDAQPGLVRRTRADLLLWQVAAPTRRLTVLPPDLAQAALRGDRGPSADALRTTPTGAVGADGAVPAGPAGRLLVLSEAADDGWRATVDGRPLARRTAWGWASAFSVPAAGGVVRVEHDQAGRRTTLALQAAGLLLVAVLAAPAARRRRGLEVEDR